MAHLKILDVLETLPPCIQAGHNFMQVSITLDVAGACVHAQDPRHVVTAWGAVVVVLADGSITCLKEKPLSVKLELLFSKNLYVVALNLAHSEQVGACPLACLPVLVGVS